MKNKIMRLRVDDEFLSKVEYLRKINDYKSDSDTIRKTVEKEFRKETIDEVNIYENTKN